MRIKYIIVLLIFFISSCSNNSEVSTEKDVADGLRIISLVPSISLEITQLGLKDNIVGATDYCKVSKENPDLIVGSVIDINEEKIMLLKPDIVLASGLIRKASIQILRDNGVNVVVVDKLRTFDDICDNYIKLGELLNKKQQAIDFIDEQKQRVDSIYNTIPEITEKPKVFIQIGANPLATVIAGTFINDFAVLCKAENIFSELKSIIINRESVILRNPTHIIISSMGLVGEQEQKVWSEYQDIDAVKNNNVFVVEEITTPTVASFVSRYEIIKNKIYKN